MEKDFLQAAWSQYDKKLTENLKLNEDILRKINMGKSKTEMSTTLNYEILSICISVITLLFVLRYTVELGAEIKYLLSGIITALICLGWIIFSAKKIGMLSGADYYSGSVVSLQKTISQFNSLYLKSKKFELYSFPLFAVSAMIIGAKGMRNFDITAYPLRFVTALVVAIVVGLLISFWIYKNVYEKKIKTTTALLTEIEDFEKNDEA